MNTQRSSYNCSAPWQTTSDISISASGGHPVSVHRVVRHPVVEYLEYSTAISGAEIVACVQCVAQLRNLSMFLMLLTAGLKTQ